MVRLGKTDGCPMTNHTRDCLQCPFLIRWFVIDRQAAPAHCVVAPHSGAAFRAECSIVAPRRQVAKRNGRHREARRQEMQTTSAASVVGRCLRRCSTRRMGGANVGRPVAALIVVCLVRMPESGRSLPGDSQFFPRLVDRGRDGKWLLGKRFAELQQSGVQGDGSHPLVFVLRPEGQPGSVLRVA